nr:polymer-forming cytoskeletal protein [Butyrivibrio sp.]
MGFFSELKQGLANAVDEIDPDEKAAAEKNAGQDNAGVEEVDLDSMLSHLDKIQVEDIPEPEESVAAKDKEPLKEPEEMPATESLKEPEAASKAEEALEPDYDAITFPSDPVSSFGSVDEPKEEPKETVSEPEKEEKDNPVQESYEELEPVKEPENDDFVIPSVFPAGPSFEPKEDAPYEDHAEPVVEISELDNVGQDADDYSASDNINEDGGYIMMDTERVATDETASITEGMVVNGDIQTTGSLDLIGKVIGNVTAYGKLNVTGEIEGNSNAAEIYAEAARINGDIHSNGSVKIGQSSVIIGNLYATSAVIAGAVKGDIDVHGPVVLDTTAIVMGNIKSQSVQINNGAVIEGMCSQTYAEVNPSAFFEGLKNKN